MFMKKILFSLFMLVAMTLSVSAQDVKKECQETTKKECCEGKKEGCCKEKKADNSKDKKDKKACCDKKEATAETKSCGKK
jgi:hypothetical protein